MHSKQQQLFGGRKNINVYGWCHSRRKCIGVNISERKSGTERPKKRKKLEFVFFPQRQGAQLIQLYIVYMIHGFCPSYHSPGYLYPEIYAARTKLQLYKQAKHTTFYNFAVRISFSEHWKLVAESSEFHLTLKRTHRTHFFQLEIRKK